MKKKKRGSTFIVVVIVIAIIFTTGTTVLSLTASNYKMRINESKRIKNLYEADSGLDVVENIIVKTSQEAVKYADKKVKMQFINEKNMTEDEVNNFFKEKFYEFLELNKMNYNDKEVNRQAYILEYLILNKKIISSVNEDGSIKIEDLKDVSEGKNYIISIEDNGYKINTKDGEIENITIDIKSAFETVSDELKNKRTVSTTFTIKAPDYKSSISGVDIYPVFDGKAITADGNMTVDGNKDGDLSISGDIWIKGGNTDLKDNNNFTFEKYKDGIKISNSTFNIDGNIYTSNTLNLNNEVKNALVNGDIYARNIYVGKALYDNLSSNNNITFNKNVIVNNDLAMNATNSTINIENDFYGINDKTTDALTADKALNSSSIIINESKDSNLIVKKNSYILGVAYLNATDLEGNKYQTGESVAIKGNYLAYTDAINLPDDTKSVTLKYYSPLQLLESINGSNSADAKADYFKNYFSTSSKKYEYNDGGVKLLGDIFSAGTSVKDKDGNIQKAVVTSKEMDVVNKERSEFARNVFAMGDATGSSEDLYVNQKVVRTVENQMNFNKIKDIQDNVFKSVNGSLILKADEAEALENRAELVIENNIIDGQEVKKGLIITNRNIKIKGSFEFEGTIITTGNITFEGNENKEIKYDPNIVRGVIADNYDAVKDIFKSEYSKGKEVKVSSSSEMYNQDSFLSQSLWKIER